MPANACRSGVDSSNPARFDIPDGAPIWVGRRNTLKVPAVSRPDEIGYVGVRISQDMLRLSGFRVPDSYCAILTRGG